MRASEITLSVLRGTARRSCPCWRRSCTTRWWSGARGKTGVGAPRRDRSGWPRKEALDKIKSRLEGVVVGVGSAPSLPLSPQGQARRLIEEATSRKGQGSMYIWWMSWFWREIGDGDDDDDDDDGDDDDDDDDGDGDARGSVHARRDVTRGLTFAWNRIDC